MCNSAFRRLRSSTRLTTLKSICLNIGPETMTECCPHLPSPRIVSAPEYLCRWSVAIEDFRLSAGCAWGVKERQQFAPAPTTLSQHGHGLAGVRAVLPPCPPAPFEAFRRPRPSAQAAMHPTAAVLHRRIAAGSVLPRLRCTPCARRRRMNTSSRRVECPIVKIIGADTSRSAPIARSIPRRIQRCRSRPSRAGRDRSDTST
jgi:hypothetical protein